MTTAVNGYNVLGYPSQTQITANPTGTAATLLGADFARDFGLAVPGSYNIPFDVTSMYGMPYGMGMGMGMYGMNPYMMSQQYIKYMNMDYKERLLYDADLRRTAAEIEYNGNKNTQNYAVASDGLTASIREACNGIQTVAMEGETDQIITQYERIVESLRRSPLYERIKEEFKDDPYMQEQTLRNMARDQFMASTGQDIKALVQQNCDGAFSNGFWSVLSFGNSQKHSAEEAIAEMDGTRTPKSVRTKKALGKAGGVATITAGGAAAGFLVGGPIGAIVGGAVGLIGGAISAFTN